jgi:predicted acyl esterase
VFYTGTTGEPVPVVKGWLRLSLRKVDTSHPQHRHYLPYRHYLSSDVKQVQPGEIYPVDVEMWPTSVVLGRGHTLGLEIASMDTQGHGLTRHDQPEDRNPDKLRGLNRVHVGPTHQSWLELPVIPSK